MSNIQNTLKALGLLDSEIRTYLAALELGPSTVIDIANKTKLSRQAIYTSINKLIAEGLMSSVEKGKKSLYSTESPERLLSYAQSKLKRMEATVREIKDASEDLKLLQRGEKPIVRMFEGKEGQFSIYEDIIKSKPERIDDFVNDDANSQIFDEDEFKPYKEKLDKLNIHTRVIEKKDSPQIFNRKNVKGRRISRKDIAFNGDVTVYGNKVALSSLRNKMVGVIIESEDIAQTIRAMFQLAWESRLD